MAEAVEAAPAVEPEKELASMPERRGGESYVLPWGHKFYHVYRKDVISFAKCTNAIPTATELGRLLGGDNSDDWFPFLRPDYLMRIKGIEGNQVFTTFDLPGVPSEKRILRVVPNHAAEHCFRQHKDRYRDKARDTTNPRRQIRFEVLNWRVIHDLQGRGRDEGYVLSPITNSWPEATFEAGTAAIWPGPSRLTAMASNGNEDYWELEMDSDEDEEQASYTGARPTRGPLQHVPFVRAPAHEAARMRAATEKMRFAHNKMKCIRSDTHAYVARLLRENVQAQQQEADTNTAAIGMPEMVGSEASTKASVCKATDELFDIKHQLSEGSYLEITNALKRTWDMAI